MFLAIHSLPENQKYFDISEITLSACYPARPRPVLLPLDGGLVDDEAGLQPHDGKVHVDHHGLLLVVDVADLLDHEPEVIVPRQGFVL